MPLTTRTLHSTLRGFTLIELMLVVVIIGILAMFAYPAYTRWVVETRRSDAHIALSQLANELEKFYSECGVYTANIAASPRSCDLGGALARSNLSPREYYDLSVALTGGGTGYTITATPREAQAADTDCTSLTLSNTGATGATGANAARCWKK